METLLISGVHTFPDYPPIALGMCMTYANKVFAESDVITVSPQLIFTEDDLLQNLETKPPEGGRHLLLFSNYLWSSQANLGLSRLAKRKDPTCITVHGGPDVPGYTEASQEFLRREPHVDYAVAGEGEQTLVELLALLSAGEADVSGVSGLRFMDKGKFVTTGNRERSRDIETFPSPYLSGFFNGIDGSKWDAAIVETFRGCPYQCTFCDWGSLSGSKVKSFGLERVMAELRWLAENKITTVWLGDSNFGMFERDVEITRRICELKKETGYPKFMVATFAKNVKSRVVDIVEMMADAGVLGTGIISLQTQDIETLTAIRRANIKTSEYEKLRRKFAEKNLPLIAELMMALPGSTLESLKSDLAYHFDLSVDVHVWRTVMLVNSPMAEPGYRRRHRIEIDEQSRVVSTSTMSAEDITEAECITRLFQLTHRFGILRYLLRWLQWEADLAPLDVIHDLLREGDEGAGPLLTELVRGAGSGTHWAFGYLDPARELRERLRKESRWDELSKEFIAWASGRYTLPSDNRSFAVLGDIQASVMPDARHRFPLTVEMTFDAEHWYRDWLNGEGRPLATYGPGTLRVDDPYQLSSRQLSPVVDGSPYGELQSGLAQSRRDHAKQPLKAPAPSDPENRPAADHRPR